MINENIDHMGDRMQKEFKSIEKYTTGKGVDVGCGTNRLSMEILAIDEQADRRYAHADVVHNCHDLEIYGVEFSGDKYTFDDNSLDFIFSSHCLEDFPDIPVVFLNWWKKLKADGLMILLLPDMEECQCNVCQSESAIKDRKKQSRSARYWTIADYDKTKKGNPAHKTNVGKSYMTDMLNGLDIKYEMVQCDTLAHNETCTIDFVIKKL